MQIIYKLLLVLVLMVATAPISYANDMPDLPIDADSGSEVKTLSEKVELLDRSISELQKNQYSDGADNSSINRLNATTIAQLEEIREQVKGLRGEIEQIQFDNSRINEKIIKLAADFDHRLSELKKKNKNEKAESIFEDLDENLDNDLILEQNDSKAHQNRKSRESAAERRQSGAEVAMLVREKEMQRLYDEAYEFLKAKKVKEASEHFKIFVQEYPDTDLAGNAYYWIGEIYFQKRVYDKSAIEYLKGYQANIRGSRAADNLLKLGMSLSKLEKRKEACTTYMKLEKEFPNTTNMIKKKNASEIEKLRCKTS